MDNDILFEEVQTFTKKSTQDFFKISVCVLLASSILSLFVGTANAQELAMGLLSGALIAAIVGYALGTARLTTCICTEGIYLRFSPFHRGYSQFNWEDIKYIYIRSYNPLLEYGGWGIRFSSTGTAYSVGGKIGLQLVFHNDTKVLIGTKEPEKIALVLQRLGRLDLPVE